MKKTCLFILVSLIFVSSSLVSYVLAEPEEKSINLNPTITISGGRGIEI